MRWQGWLGIAVILIGVAANQWSIGFLLSSDGGIQSTFNRNLIFAFQLLLIAVGTLFLLSSRYPKLAKAVGVSVSIGWKLLIAVLLVELFFGGWFNPLNRLNNLNIPRNSVMQYDVSSLYPRSTLITYTRDKYGLRGSYSTLDSIDVLTMGGSSTDQSMVSDEETWQMVWQSESGKRGAPLTVVNAGRNGQSTIGHIKCFELWFPALPDFKPNYILYYIGENDLNGGEWERDSLVTNTKPKNKIINRLRHNSYLFTPIHNFYRRLKNDHGFPVNKAVLCSEKEWTTTPLWADSLYNRYMAEHLQQFEYRLNRLLDQTEQLGARPILVTHPTRHWRFRDGRLEGVVDSALFYGLLFNGVDKYRMMHEQNLVMAKVAGERNAIFFNAGEQNIWQDDDFYDLVHFTPQGCRRFGKLLSDSLHDYIHPLR